VRRALAFAALAAALAAPAATAQERRHTQAAAPTGDLFSDANAAYLSGDLPRAIAAYEALASEGITSPELETNLGAAYLQQGRRGLAALHLERALFLDPGDEDARADLAEVRRGNVDRLEGESEESSAETLSRLLSPLPGGAAAALLLLFWTAGWGLLGLRMLRPARRSLGVGAGLCLGLAVVAAGVTVGAAVGHDLALQRAVVIARSAPAREGPNDKSASHFEVHEGTTVRVEDEQGGFRRIKLANGLTGWVEDGAVDLVVPPGWAGRPVLASR
jgi:tetratricopeptide (TPR) repeat protein